jgi:hypothetical protein
MTARPMCMSRRPSFSIKPALAAMNPITMPIACGVPDRPP